MTGYLENYKAEFGVEIPRAERHNILDVPQGRHRIGQGTNIFVSRKIRPCSGYLLVDRSASFYAYFHSYPYPDISDEHLKELSDFRGGKFRPINGSESTEKSMLQSYLARVLGITAIASLSIQTLDSQQRPGAFSTLFMPETNRLYAARSSHQDVLVFDAF